MAKRKAKSGGAKKATGPGFKRKRQIVVKGGPIAPNPASLAMGAASIARGMLGGQKQVVGEWLRNAGEMGIVTTAREAPGAIAREQRAQQQAQHQQQVSDQLRTRIAQGARPEGPPRPTSLPRDTSKKPTTFKVSSAKPPSTRARRPGMRAE